MKEQNMLCGYFDDEAHPVISVQLIGPHGVIDVILTIDTGFDDDIYIPVSTAIALGLPLRRVGFIEMIDGSVKKQFIFKAECQMGDLPPKDVNVYITESEDGLIGARMFQNLRLEIDYGQRTVSLVSSQRGIE
jgi:predicted aspartyl protease